MHHRMRAKIIIQFTIKKDEFQVTLNICHAQTILKS